MVERLEFPHNDKDALSMRASRLAFVGLVLVLIASCTPAASDDPEQRTTTPAVTVTGADPTAPPPPPAPIVPLLRRSGAQSDLYVGQQVHLTGEVLAASSIARMELWVNDRLVEEASFDEPISDPSYVWWWTPGEPGLHAATMRAFDSEGRAAGSFPTWIRAHPLPDVPLAEGLLREVVLSFQFGMVDFLVDEPSCTATVNVPASSASSGHTVAATTLGMGGFVPLAIMGPGGGSITVPLAATPLLLAVESYDPTLATPLNPVFVPGVAGCASGQWAGDVTFAGSVLIGEDEIDRAYLYATTNGSTWSRYPEGDGTFVESGPQGFDFSGLLPQVPADGFIEVEVWGWSGDQLVGLGRSVFEPWKPPPPAAGQPEIDFGPLQPAGPFGNLNIVRSVADGPDLHVLTDVLLLDDVVCAPQVFNFACHPDPVRLRWTMSPTSVPEDGLLQVSTAPPPSGPAISFPGMLAATKVATDGLATLDVQLVTKSVLGDGGNLVSGQVPKLDYSHLETLSFELSNPTSTPEVGGWARSSNIVIVDVPQAIPSRLWVRIIPFSDGKPIAGTTNAVELAVESDSSYIQPSPESLMAGLGIEGRFFQPSIGTADYFRCVRVVENPFLGQNPVPDYLQNLGAWESHYNSFRDSATLYGPGGAEKSGLVVGSTVCAYKPNPPSKGIFDYLSDAVDFVGSVWDMYADLLAMMKSGIINGIVDLTGCEPKASCAAALTVLADIGLAAIGVPPSMPSFNELMEAAKGDLTTLAATAAINAVGCDLPDCQQWAEDLVGEIIDQVEDYVSDMAT
ncbi:MAG: hypothetical protein ACFCU2_00055, partial [Acidimicrobiia bacterium]